MPCLKCDDQDIVLIEASIDAYIQSIDKDIACEASLYKQRLSICENCGLNREGMCGICGCFVRVRAYKNHMSCPSPEGNKWICL